MVVFLIFQAIEVGEVNTVGLLLQEVVISAAAQAGMLKVVRVGQGDHR